MNDVERLAEALRKANAELEVDPNELADAVQHAHRRLLGRLLAVAALSAVGALLLLSGGLAASQAVKEGGEEPPGADKAHRDANGAAHHHHHTSGEHDGGGNDPGGPDKGGGGNEHHQKAKQQAHSNISSGQSTKQKGGLQVEHQANLKVTSLTATGIEVFNDGIEFSGPFMITIRVDPVGEEPYEKTLSFDALAPEHSAPQNFAKELSCEKGGLILAEIDPENLIEESDEEDNTESGECEPASNTGESNDGTQGTEESTTSSAIE